MKLSKQLNEAIKKAYSLTEEEHYGLAEEDYIKIKEAIDTYIKENRWIKDNSFDIYVDYRDELEESTIKKIFESDRPLDTYYEIIGDFDWWESADYEYDEIFKNLKLDDDFKEGERDAIMEILQDTISYNIPYDHFDKTINLDVFFNDPEEANVEYNELISWEETEEKDADGDTINKAVDLSNEVKILLKSQGYTTEQFLDYINNNVGENKFFKSLMHEIYNYTYKWGGQMVFLVQASIIEIAKAIQEHKNITVPTSAMCGFFNGGNGSGSVLEIELEKPISGAITDMTKPSYQAREGMFEVFFNHGYHYNVDEVYGLVGSAWDNALKIEG